MICAYIDQYRHQFGVEPICRVLTEHNIQIAPSSYYAHRRQPVTDALRTCRLPACRDHLSRFSATVMGPPLAGGFWQSSQQCWWMMVS